MYFEQGLSPRRKDVNTTLFETYSDIQVSHAKLFGCLSYVGVPTEIRKKPDIGSNLGIIMGFALHTKGYRIWLRDENKLIETITVRFVENTKGIGASQNSNRYSKINFIISFYSDEDDLDTVIDSLFGRLIPETSSESLLTSREEPSASRVSSLIPCSEIKLIRKIGREVTGVDIYYGIEGKETRLKSFNEIERHYKEHKIHFDKNLLDFSGGNSKSKKLPDSAEGQQEANVVEVKITTCYQHAIRPRDASEWCDTMDMELKKKEDRASVISHVSNLPNTLLHYPKIKLPSFDGNVKKWLGFWGHFQRIDNYPNMVNYDKFAHLSQARLNGYNKSLKQLQAPYGSHELLIQVYVRDLLSMELLKQKSFQTSLRKFYDQLETKLRALDTLGITSDKYAAILYPLDHPSLPDKFELSLKRFNAINNHLRAEGLHEKYGDIFKERLKDKIIEEVPDNELQLRTQYLPHRPVVNL
ncbi:hypothetical protein AVEN_96559-1 [Araneus ventricosus]|uniref:Retroviral polymerase SH3-like domain-containing protein n=1 Tax=Araneus ventricosus TaxID=182803 RepID=A0A4Y2H9E7_ARAVE|nr:hypothetical protein AVEN_96559-1 [Araneus ventricosus]